MAVAFRTEDYVSILDSLRDIVLRVDLSGTVLYTNEAWRSSLGFDPAASVGQSVLNFVHPEDHEKKLASFVRLVKREQDRCNLTVRYLTAGGGVRTCEVFMRIELGPDGEAAGVAGTVTDVTERLEAEAELRAAREAALRTADAKGTLLATVAHEMRSPLHAILGLSSSLDEQALPENQRKPLKVIRRSADSLMALLNDTLELSRLEAGGLNLAREAVSPNELVERVSEALELQAEGKGLRLVTSVSGDLPAWVAGDALRLRQILTNLVGNAIRATVEGEVRIEVRATGDSWTLSVADTGPGIAATEMAQIFEPYRQGARGRGAAGLGLPITRKLVELMGGQLSLISTVGRGSTFSATLPLEAATPEAISAAAAVREAAEAVAKPEELAPMKLLLVDDDPDARLVVRTYLEGSQVRITEASNGLEAIEAAIHDRFDLALMDVNMPVLDGPSAVTAIRDWEHEQGLDPMAIVALSGSSMEVDFGAAMSAGYDDFLTKPLRKSTLYAMLNRFTGESVELTVGVAEGPAPSAVEAYLGRRMEDVKRARGLSALGDFEGVRIIGHNLKGTGATFGFQALSNLGGELEKAARARDPQGVSKALQELDAFMVRVEQPRTGGGKAGAA